VSPLRRLNAWLGRRFGPVAGKTDGGSHCEGPLPDGARAYLRPDHPDLVALNARYAAMDPRVVAPAEWTDEHLPPEELLWFRGDNAYVWQVRGHRDAEAYARSYRDLREGDQEGLLDRFAEDGAFGVHAFEMDGRKVTRDLLDSAREIQFLVRRLGIDRGEWNVLDIGAGYGRLAHRLHELGNDRLRVFATDAFAPSTHICRYYLGLRGADRAETVPLDEVEALFARTRIDLALNVHSFSECRFDAIEWWVERLARPRVRHLMVVPNEGRSEGARCETNDGRSFEPILARHGYRPVAREPRYSDPAVQRDGIDPVWLHLFELGAAGA
jgi:SAM-dependent methyltransferase